MTSCCAARAGTRRCRQRLRTPGRPPATVILDRRDDVRFTHTALLSHAPAAGRIVVHPTVPAGGRLLWHDVLRALSEHRPDERPPYALPDGRAEHEAVYQAARALPGCRMTVLRAHLIGTDVWMGLIHFHRTTRVDVTLIHHAELSEELVHLLSHCDHRVLDTVDAMRALHPPALPTAR